ncbi:aminodeoxychorismate synthase component I [Salicola sp. Rm-C-2C1-2]|uniref:aminodeoxychorismate synthase component I n=1 Tax=Salicola sp. Rm-C-2C1-2 TaxID=3141321 RepID=UPI0032E44460
MESSQPLLQISWSTLTRALSQEPGFCVFDVPGATRDPAPVRILTALPRFRETRYRCADHSTNLSDHARQAPGSGEGWLPLKLGFVAYGDGEMELADRAPSSMPLVQVNEYDWLILYRPEAGTLELRIHPDCPLARKRYIHAHLEALAQRPDQAAQPAAFHLTARFRPLQSRALYLERIQRILDYIHAGDVYQVNYAQPFSAHYQGHPIHAFQALYSANPGPCSVYFDTGANCILSLSPERFLRVREGLVETRPIKGTRRRGDTPSEDRQLAQALLASPKDRAENLMIVDLLRNDLGRCCRTGSIRAAPLFALETFANVHHLVSCITGELAHGLSPLDLLLSAFPGGSITGAPKRRAMEIIRELEEQPRGVYCGSFFHWSPGNGFDSTIAIRTLECRDGEITCFGGGGIVADSQPEAEYQESITKIQLLMDVLERLQAPAS